MDSKRFWNTIVCFFFPERCIFCNTVIAANNLCCEACAKTIHPVKPPLCYSCGANKKECTCEKHKHHYERVVAPFYYKDAVRGGILRLKQWDDPRAVAYFSGHMAAALRREFPDLPFDMVCYMPMTKRAHRERQYNQSELLAKQISERLQLRMQHALIKLYETLPQKRLKLWQRKGNVLGVYDVASMVTDKRIVLVDDLHTTGASVDECAKMLKIYGAQTITVLTIAVTEPKEE